MKKLNKIILLATLLISFQALADFYGQIGLGQSFNAGSIIKDNKKIEFKDSSALSFAGGYVFPIPVFNPRIETEYMRFHPKVKEGSVTKFNGLFLNGYTDIPLLPIIDTYVGAGIGMTRFEHNNSSAVQGMFGIEYEIPVISTTIGGEYRYLKINETGGKGSNEAKYHTNILMLKVRYSF